MSFQLSPEAAEELTEAMSFYAGQASAAVARAFLAEFSRAAEMLSRHPGLGTSTLNGRRFYPLRRFPYSLLYRADGGIVRVIAVAHQHRSPGYWRART